MHKYDLTRQFQNAMREIDPLARALVLEVNPRSSLDVDPEDEPVVMDERMLRLLNDFLGPNYKVVERHALDGRPSRGGETVGDRIARESKETPRVRCNVCEGSGINPNSRSLSDGGCCDNCNGRGWGWVEAPADHVDTRAMTTEQAVAMLNERNDGFHYTVVGPGTITGVPPTVGTSGSCAVEGD